MSRRRNSEAGFTLLEVLVATMILAIAVAGLMSNLTQSLSNLARLTDHDRGVMLGRQKMDELITAVKLPRNQEMAGQFDPAMAGGLEAGWKARVTLLDMPPGAGPGALTIDRVDLQVWWKPEGKLRTFELEGVRKGVLTPADLAAMGAGVAR